MTKIKMLIELEYDEEMIHGSDKDAMEWFYEDILKNDQLLLHSNDIGDIIGKVKTLEIVKE